MNLIETFGAKVGALSETNPQRARRCSPPLPGQQG